MSTTRHRSSRRLGPALAAVIALLPVCGLASDGAAPLAPVPLPDQGEDCGVALCLGEVLDSTVRHYPRLLAAAQERFRAEGGLTAARGGFDVRLEVDADARLQGFYENDRIDVELSRPTTLWGAELFGGYRRGAGDFADYDKDLETNADGEWRAGISLPLLRDRAIDSRREKLGRARIERDRAEPVILESRLDAEREASLAYWEWVAAGEKLEIARRLLQLAEARQAALSEAVAEGLLPGILLTDNARLLAERRALEIGALRKLQERAIDLSLFLRDDAGEPLLADESRLPGSFPELQEPAEDLSGSINLALQLRPEVRKMELERQDRELQIRTARNRLLPALDLGVKASQDMGEAASVPDDKDEFELAAGLAFSVPLQRREARGDLAARRADLARLEHELRFARDRITAQVRDADSAMRQAWLRFAQASENVRLALELEDAERLQMAEGNSDLLRVNIREQQTAQAAAFRVDVATEYFEALSRYRAALGLASGS